ncbi:hypothetical protein ACHAXT_003890 [Thalassiosira profunda]
MTHPSPAEHAVLRAPLLRGALSVKVADLDVRRSTDAAAGGCQSSSPSLLSAVDSLLFPIETDYILQVKAGGKVTFEDGANKASGFAAYAISKRYVDMRDLASAMRGHAVEIVKHYAGQQTSKPGAGSSGSGGSSILRGLEKALSKPVQFVELLSNSEPRSSDLAAELDGLFGNKPADGSGGKESKVMRRRTSEFLTEGAPKFAREVVVGVDEFYEAIYSEKRQFGQKSNYAHVKAVAERRRAIIDRAFASMARALSAADVASVSEGRPESIPNALEMLIQSLEKFLLTDVVDQDEDEAEKSAPQDTAAGNPTSGSAVNPVTTRRRASVAVRAEEEKMCQAVAELVLTQSHDEGDATAEESTATTKGEDASTAGGKIAIEAPTGLLPEHPLDFAVLVAVGALLFKLLEGRVMQVQLDMLLLCGLGCGMLGYQMGRPSVIYVEKAAAAEKKRVTSPAKQREAAPERKLPSRRALLTKSAGSLDLKARRKSLIQASLQSVRRISAKPEGEMPVEEKVVPAKTFDKFPDGAAIGSHLNCWSSPPSTNFKVRGANYLRDKKKIPSDDFLLPSRGCDLFLTDDPPQNMGRARAILNGKLRDVPTFIINYRLPWGVFLSYHEIPDRFLPFLRRGHGYGDLSVPLPSLESMPPGERALCNFFLSDEKEKNEVWKIVPVVVEGPWVVKRVVGGKPAIVGTKMPITYVYQPPEKGLAEYLEADLDIVSSAAARNILAVVRSYTQTLTIDLGYVVQGNKEEELPEQMMLGMRLHGLDPLTAELMPDFEGGSTLPELTEESGYDTE